MRKLIYTFTLAAYVVFNASNAMGQEPFYTTPIAINPVEETVFILNRIAIEINSKLNLEGVSSVLRTPVLLEKYQDKARLYLSQERATSESELINNNLILIRNLKSLNTSHNEFNIEKEIQNLNIDLIAEMITFNELYLPEDRLVTKTRNEIDKDIKILNDLPEILVNKLQIESENPDSLYITSKLALKEINSFIRKYQSPFYIKAENGEELAVELNIKKVLQLHKTFSFFTDFLNPSKNYNYLPVMDQDIKTIKIGHATESLENFQVSEKPKASSTKKLEKLRLGNSKQLEKVNKDQNI